MLVLDTDHLTEIDRAGAVGARLQRRLLAAGQEVAATVISAEEQLRGWLAQIHRLNNDPRAQIPVYTRLQRRLEFYAHWTVLPWNEDAAELFINFRSKGVRVGSMDLKIASIALAHHALLLTGNEADFSEVPGLRFENWLR